MNLKDPKTQKTLLVVLALFIGVYFWYQKVYIANQQELAGERMRHEALLTELKNVEMRFRSLDALKGEYRELTGRYQRIASLLPEEKEISRLLAKLHSAAIETQSHIMEIKPRGLTPEGFYNRDDYQVMMYTTYHDLGRFLAKVANFPFVVNISDVNMGAVDPNVARTLATESQTATATFTLSTYHVKDAERLVLLDL